MSESPRRSPIDTFTICIVGDVTDLTSVYVGWCAENRGWRVLRLAEEGLGDAWTFALNEIGAGHLEVDGRCEPLKHIGSAYVRFHPEPAPIAKFRLEGAESTLALGERREAIHRLLEILPCPVANHPYSGRSNASKPYQMGLLQEHGFLVPHWIATNDVDEARSFAREFQRGVIYKSISGLRSRVRRFDDVTLDALRGSCPLLIQEFIDGDDIRVHVVGDRVFATRILSTGVDYRWQSEDARYEVAEISEDLTRLCVLSTRREKLLVSGIDFRVTEKGDWYCLEINPVPTFLPYEMSTQQPICSTLLDLLEWKS